MTAKKKTAPRPRWQDRAARSARAHPWLTWTTIGGTAALIGMIPILAPYMPHWQTAEAADAHAKQDQREFAALLYGQQRIEVLILGGKVNECRSRARPNDRAACADYEQAYRSARDREKTLYEMTQKGGAK